MRLIVLDFNIYYNLRLLISIYDRNKYFIFIKYLEIVIYNINLIF